MKHLFRKLFLLWIFSGSLDSFCQERYSITLLNKDPWYHTKEYRAVDGPDSTQRIFSVIINGKTATITHIPKDLFRDIDTVNIFGRIFTFLPENIPYTDTIPSTLWSSLNATIIEDRIQPDTLRATLIVYYDKGPAILHTKPGFVVRRFMEIIGYLDDRKKVIKAPLEVLTYKLK